MMSETILRINVDELTTIRVRCKHCNAVLEMDLKQWLDEVPKTTCGNCHKPLLKSAGRDDPLTHLIVGLEGMKNQPAIGVEFLVSEPKADAK